MAMRLGLALSALILAILANAAPAGAADYPDRALKVIVPFPAGGFIDTVARIASQHLSSSIGQPLVVENRGGAGGKIGEEFVAKTDPDGYTLLVDIITRPTLMQAVNTGEPETIDIQKAFVPIGAIGASPMILNVSPDLGVKDFASFVQKIKSEPGKHNYASAGLGTPSHIVSAQLVRELGLKAVHTPYRGGAPALQDVASGVMSWMVDTPSGSLGLSQAGKIVPIFVVNPTRVKELPDVPTLAELGYPSFTNEIMAIYLMAPAGVPKPVIDRLSAAMMQLQADAAVRSRLEKIAIEPSARADLQATRAQVSEQIDAWDKAVKKALEQ
jgi:tripartite-type tricarboxylate transporter receptor subunit TctC